MSLTPETAPAWSYLLTQELPNLAERLGFLHWGISDSEIKLHAEALGSWLSRGDQADMSWMQTHQNLRQNPSSLHPNSVRVISFSFPYQPESTHLPVANDLHNWEGAPINYPDSHMGWISRYALGRDYHKKLRKKLKVICDQLNDIFEKLVSENEAISHWYKEQGIPDMGGISRPFVDSAPVLERGFAEQSGLGWIGKNCMLIHPKSGSWSFLGEIYTLLPLPLISTPVKDHCGSCQRCLEACPTGAFRGPGQLDARRCISYLTIEHKGALPLSLRPLIGNRVFGCDDCQIVCPWNHRFGKTTSDADFSPRSNLDQSSLLDLFNWSEAEFLKKTEGSPIRRLGFEGWKRNLAVAIGNADYNNAPDTKAQALTALEKALGISELIDEHLHWAMHQIRTSS